MSKPLKCHSCHRKGLRYNALRSGYECPNCRKVFPAIAIATRHAKGIDHFNELMAGGSHATS